MFLEDYYFLEKETVFHDIYASINQSDTENQTLELYQMCVTNNISIITQSESLILDLYIVSSDNNQIISKSMEERLLNYIKYGLAAESISVETENYQITRVYDDYLQTYYLEMYGILDNGNYFLMRTPVSGIVENLSTINKFSYFSYIFCICIGIIFINILSNIITYPIEKLCDISKKISNLDFSEMHTGSVSKEVDELGVSLNNLSKTLDVTLDELQKANEQLEKDINKQVQIDDMRKEFIANVSHELKTPIALIQGYAEGLKECVNDEDREFYYDVIMDESQKMDKMVKQLIELNKIEFGYDDSAIVPIHLNHFIEDTLKSLDVLLRDVDLEIITDGDFIVLFDKFKLEQILNNYLTNAIHHVDSNNKIKITITNGDKIKLAIYNSGSPISEKDQVKIWEKFYKVDKARTRTYGGSGIGLSIVSAIMNAYGEKFGVENKDEGVEFYIYLKKVKT